jgi:putative membrane-bound dehydrogenase-like protein
MKPRSSALFVLVWLIFSSGSVRCQDHAPEVSAVLPGVSLSLVAEQPLLATPTGVDADAAGNLWVVACHTHMPPPDYAGPKFDEILVFSSDGRRRVFYDRTFHTMDLELGPDGWVYLAERGRILRIKDQDGDGAADVSEDLAMLETAGDYPHNALSALAWHPDGSLWFGLGENFAKPWKLKGTDGASVEGTGEGGIFRMAEDGSKLRRVAYGMWNPFGLFVRDDGEVFASDNDPGESPPCRLLHIVEGGDYGYNRRYGSDAFHPFVGWNGELRGTLPMVHPTGEGPCGVVGLGRGVMVPSWSDHRIDFLPLTQKGASYEAKRIALVQGGPFFRPTCIAAIPGKSAWVVADWVDGRYPVHGFGRLWKLEIDLAAAASWIGPMDLERPTQAAMVAAGLRDGKPGQDRAALFVLAGDSDPVVSRSALQALSRQAKDWTPAQVSTWPAAERMHALLALRLAQADPVTWAPGFLKDADAAVSFESLRWIADAGAVTLLPGVEAMISRPDLDFARFEAALAARNTLLGKPEAGARDPELLLAKVLDSGAPPRIRAMALRLLPAVSLKGSGAGTPPVPAFPRGLTVEVLQSLLAAGNEDLAMEAVRTLASQPSLGEKPLASLAQDPTRSIDLRAQAVAGLQPVAEGQRSLLLRLAAGQDSVLADEALRALRGVALSPAERETLQALPVAQSDPARAILDPGFLAAGRPQADEVEAWLARLNAVPGEADVEAGRRIFHSTRIALCANCHRRDGRGQMVGPDLSRPRDRRVVLESILDPSATIAPEYLPRQLDLKDGSSFVGIRLRSSTQEVMRDVYGQNRAFPLDQIVGVRELETSFMPPGLAYGLTDRELRDLVAFLSQ